MHRPHHHPAIIEQSIEWQPSLYVTFVDFEKAFVSVDGETIWKLMHHYGIPQKFINIIQHLYEDSSCQIIHCGGTSLHIVFDNILDGH